MNDPEALVTIADIDNAAATVNVVPGEAAPAAVTPAETTAGSAPAPTEAPQGDQAPAEPPATAEPPDWFVREKSKLQRQRRDADRRAERLAAELEALKRTPVQPQKQSTDIRAQDYPNYDAYVEAKIEAKTEEKIGALTRSHSEQESQRAAQSRQAAFLEKAQEQAEAAGIDLEEVVETLAQPHIPFTAMVMNLITESEHTARLAEYLAEHPEELARVSQLGPALAKKSLAKVEASFGAKPKPNATNAPPPPPRVGGRTVTQQSWRESDDMEAYAAGWRKEREARSE
jgi:hypothetical protein